MSEPKCGTTCPVFTNPEVQDLKLAVAVGDARYAEIIKSMASVQKDVTEMKEAILGNPVNSDSPGLHGRLSRLEDKQKSRDKIVWTSLSGMITLVLTRLGEAIK